MTTEQILAEIRTLTADQIVETNSGTFSATECQRAVGTGDPRFGEYRVFERLDGTRYTTGCDPKNAPGYARKFSSNRAVSRRARVELLTGALKSAKSAEGQREADIAWLATGWSGYQFIGVEEGQRRIDAMRGK